MKWFRRDGTDFVFALLYTLIITESTIEGFPVGQKVYEYLGPLKPLIFLI